MKKTLSRRLPITLLHGDNSIRLIAEGSGERVITEYVFSGDNLSQIIVVEEIDAEELVEAVYEGLKENEEIRGTYQSIQRVGNQIIMPLKDEYLALFADRSKEDLFEEMRASLAQDS